MKKLILMLMLCMPLATFAQKFGHVNAQEIMQSMPEFIKARGEVEAAAKQYDTSRLCRTSSSARLRTTTKTLRQ